MIVRYCYSNVEHYENLSNSCLYYVHNVITCIVHVPNLCRGSLTNTTNCCIVIMLPNISYDSVRAGMYGGREGHDRITDQCNTISDSPVSDSTVSDSTVSDSTASDWDMPVSDSTVN